MASAQTFDPKPIPRRTTWVGFRTTSVTVNGGNPPSPAVSASCDFYDNPQANGSPKLQLTSAAEKITIHDASTWDIQVLKVKPELPPARWYYRLMVTCANGDVKNYLKGVLVIE